MIITARHNYLRISPRKVRLVIDKLAGMPVQQAEARLRFTQKRAAKPVLKLLQSAISNAVNNGKLDKAQLLIKTITADEGTVLKRYMPRAFGRATVIRKRSTHLAITLVERGAKKKKAAEKKSEKKAEKKESTKPTKPAATPAEKKS